MKILYIKLVAILLVVLAGQEAIWASGESTNSAQAIRFKNQSNKGMNVVFEDPSLTQFEQKSILQDYQLLVGHLAINGRRLIEKGHRTTLKQQTGDLILSHAVVYTKGRKKLPDGYENEFGLIAVGEDGVEYLVIPRRLSIAYSQAFRLKNENKNAFSRLPKFLQFMNHLEGEDIPSIDALLYLHGAAKEYREQLEGKTAADFIHDYGKHAYAMPSILTVLKGKDELQNALKTEMTIIDKETGSHIGELPLVYHDDRWKILIIIPGT